MPKMLLRSISVLAILVTSVSAQSSPSLTVQWPDDEKPVLRLVFAAFVKAGQTNGQGIYTSAVTAQNLAEQSMPRSMFTVNVLDASGIKIGSTRLRLDPIPPYRTATAQVQFSAVGTPAKVTLMAGKTVSLAVKSVPPGATFSVDGEAAGVAPKLFDFTIGSHTIEFHKDGYAPGSTQLDVGVDELPGGSITLELGGLSQDMVEMRDGTTLAGDLLSLTLEEAQFQSEGTTRTLARNQIRKISLVERLPNGGNPGGAIGKDMVQFREGTVAFGEVISMSAKEVVFEHNGKEVHIDRRIVKRIVHEEPSAAPEAGSR